MAHWTNGSGGVFARLSAEIAGQVESAAGLLVAVHTAAGDHATGFLWGPGLIVTCAQALPDMARYLVTRPDGATVAGDPVLRHDATHIAAVRVPSRAGWSLGLAPVVDPPQVGTLVLVLGADRCASPTARLAAVHLARDEDNETETMRLDAAAGSLALGGPVLDPAGRLVGMTIATGDGAPAILPCAVIARVLAGAGSRGTGKREWSGLSLQPISIPGSLQAATGQASGRLVVAIAPAGGAARAGLRAGDILLTLDGESIARIDAVRGLSAMPLTGAAVEIRLVRDGRIQTRHMVEAREPSRPWLAADVERHRPSRSGANPLT